ncbi:MAG: hypothetical protein EA428_12390 [Spirochaetaceae bacterium]|nr:MAG: hypothetical protein EA428_12390 [Spirochaetaceae bacterium]
MKAWRVQLALLVVLLLAFASPQVAHAQLADSEFWFGAPIPSPVSAHDRALAEAHRDEARNLLQSGRTEEALELLFVSLQYDPHHSDGQYEVGLHYIQEQSGRLTGILHMIRALENDSFQFGSYGNALYQAAWELLDLGYTQTASTTLEQFRLNELGQADLQAVRARLALEMGEIREAEHLAEQGLSQFPNDSRFMMILLERGGTPAFRESRWIERERSSDRGYLTTLLRYIELLGDGTRQRALVEDYLRLGGDDPRVYLSGIQAGLNASMMLSGFIERGGTENSVLVRKMASVLLEHEQEDLVEDLLAPLEQFSGRLYGGHSDTGFYTEAFEFINGLPVRYEAYPGGAAEAQLVIDLDSDGLPRSLEYLHNGSRVKVEYRGYPVISQVGFGPGAFAVSSRTYSMIPDRQRWSPLRIPDGVDPSTPWPLRLPVLESGEAWEIDTEQVPRHSYRLVSRDPYVGRIISVTDLHNGVPLRTAADQNGDGRIDYIQLYFDGYPVRAVRDLNSDGLFDQIELYEAGELVATAVDEAGSGMYLYLETIGESGTVYWNETGEVVRRLWEANEGRSMSLDRFQFGAQPTEAQGIRDWAER